MLTAFGSWTCHVTHDKEGIDGWKIASWQQLCLVSTIHRDTAIVRPTKLLLLTTWLCNATPSQYNICVQYSNLAFNNVPQMISIHVWLVHTTNKHVQSHTTKPSIEMCIAFWSITTGHNLPYSECSGKKTILESSDNATTAIMRGTCINTESHSNLTEFYDW